MGKEVEVIAEADVEVVAVREEGAELLVEEKEEQRVVRRLLWYAVHPPFVTQRGSKPS